MNKMDEMKFLSDDNKSYWDKFELKKKMSNPRNKIFVEQIKKEAEFILNTNINILPFSLFKKFEENGSRKEYERVYFKRRKGMNSLVLSYLFFEDNKYLIKLEDLLWSICDEFTWCLPAHISTKENIKTWKCIDLFSAETAFTISEILYLLKDKLSKIVVERLENEIFKRVLTPYMNSENVYWWENSQMNWSAVCGGSIGSTGIYILEDEVLLKSLLKKVLKTLDFYIKGFNDDGICKEGLEYWNYGFGFFVYFSDLLKKKSGINLFLDRKIREIAKFQQKCYLKDGVAVSFSDSDINFKFNQGLTSYLYKVYGGIEFFKEDYKTDFEEDNCFRWQSIFRNLIWDNNYKKLIKNKSYISKDSQWFVSHKYNKKKIYLAAKGGNNNEPHNHNDLGSFILKVNEEVVISDLGSGLYNKDYFNKNRYNNFCAGSQGHSVPVIDSYYQKSGRNSRTEIVDSTLSNEIDYFSLDFLNVYVENLKNFRRCFKLNKNGNIVLTINDKFNFIKEPKSVIERFISVIRPEIDKNRIFFSNSQLILKSDINCELDVSTTEYVNKKIDKIKVYIIDFSIVDLKKDIDINIDFFFDT
ncbi:MAG: heparinase II/III family protein [Clostridiales bacterium]